MTEEFHGVICGDTWWNPPRNMFSNGDGWLSPCLEDHGGVGYEMTSLKENGYVCDRTNSMFFPTDLDSTFDTFLFSNSPTSSTDWNQSNLFYNGGGGQNFELNIKDDINSRICEMSSNNFTIDNKNVGQQWSPPMELTTVSSNSSEDSSTMNSEFISNINTNFPMNLSTSYLIQTLFDDDDDDPNYNKLSDQNNETPMSSNGRDFDDKTLRNIQVSLFNSLSSRSRGTSKSKKKLNNYCAKDIITKVVNEEVCDSNGNLNGQPLAKRPRIETPCHLPTFKVRKEKLGDRITALQQLVSPFGKTDTASVLHEAIEYIMYLHDQVNDFNKLKNKKEHGKDLRSKGLCVMPISSTYPIAQETPVDFWTPTFGTTPLL